MGRYELILRLDGALWLPIIFKPILTPKRAITIQFESYFLLFVTEKVSMIWNVKLPAALWHHYQVLHLHLAWGYILAAYLSSCMQPQ